MAVLVGKAAPNFNAVAVMGNNDLKVSQQVLQIAIRKEKGVRLLT